MNIQRVNNLIVSLLTLSVGLMACHKNEAVAPAPTMGTLYLHLHTNLASNEVDDYGTIYPIGNGRRAFLTLAECYISGIKAVKADGSTVALDSAIILKTKDVEQYRVQQLPAGDYTSVTFNVGLPAATNLLSPASYAATNVLSTQQPAMWFGSTTQGYMFANVQGGVDTTAAQTAPASQFQPFSYQLGTAAELTPVTLPAQPFTVVAGQGKEVHITIDYAKLLQGLNLKTENQATPFSNPAVATKVVANVAAMFRYEE